MPVEMIFGAENFPGCTDSVGRSVESATASRMRELGIRQRTYSYDLFDFLSEFMA